MKAKGKGLLCFSGVLEIVFGIIMIGILLISLGKSETESIKIFGSNPNAMEFVKLGGVWLQAIIGILAGVVGVFLGKDTKHHKICMFFGFLLLVIVILNFLNIEYTVTAVISQICASVVPILYCVGAYLNKESA